MALSETTAYKVEINEDLTIGVRRADIILKDGVEVARSYERTSLLPGEDVSDQTAMVQSITNLLWTDEAIAAYAASQPQYPSESE